MTDEEVAAVEGGGRWDDVKEYLDALKAAYEFGKSIAVPLGDWLYKHDPLRFRMDR